MFLEIVGLLAASMGPGSFDPGNFGQYVQQAMGWSASMGPGSFDPGNVNNAIKRAQMYFGFNGAGVF